MLVDPVLSATESFLGQGVLGGVAVMLIGAVVYLARQNTAEREKYDTETKALLADCDSRVERVRSEAKALVDKLRDDARIEREATAARLVQSEQGRLAEAQARIADAKEIRQFMQDFQKGESATVNSLETVAENLVRVTDDLRRVPK